MLIINKKTKSLHYGYLKLTKKNHTTKKLLEIITKISVLRLLSMKVYEAIFKEGETEGVYALSVVEDPAMQDMWIALSEQPQQIELAQVNEEKRLLLGAALIPNKKIYRNVDGNEFYITFKEETIEKLAHNFFKNQNNNNSSLEHEIKLEGMSVVEGWTVQDPNNDKSNAFGKTYEKGTWVTMMKVDNDEIWNKVKNGEIKGFSIDALLGLQEINLKTEINMNDEAKKSLKDEILEGMKAFFTSDKKEVEEVKEVENIEVQPEEVETEEVEATDRDFDVEAFKADVLEAMKAEMSAQLEAKDSELKAKNDELEALKLEMSKQAEAEEVTVTPEVTEKKQVKFNNNPIQTTASRAKENIAKAMGWQ